MRGPNRSRAHSEHLDSSPWKAWRSCWDATSFLKKVNPDRKSTRLNSSHLVISYAVFCLKKKKKSHIALELQSPHLHKDFTHYTKTFNSRPYTHFLSTNLVYYMRSSTSILFNDCNHRPHP